jgi:hypothetical protein
MPLPYNQGVFGGMNYGGKRMYGGTTVGGIPAVPGSVGATQAPISSVGGIGQNTAPKTDPTAFASGFGLRNGVFDYGSYNQDWESHRMQDPVYAANKAAQKAQSDKYTADTIAAGERMNKDAADSRTAAITAARSGDFSGLADFGSLIDQYSKMYKKKNRQGGEYDPVALAYDQLVNYTPYKKPPTPEERAASDAANAARVRAMISGEATRSNPVSQWLNIGGR